MHKSLKVEHSLFITAPPLFDRNSDQLSIDIGMGIGMTAIELSSSRKKRKLCMRL